MANEVEVEVLRRQIGDKLYEPGDTRTLNEADAKRLSDSGAVRIKGESPPQNKMAPAPSNKADLPALSSMTKDELIEQAEKEGVDLSDASNNDERREAIEKARG